MKYIIYILLIVFASTLDIYLSQMEIIPLTPAYSIIPLFFLLIVLRFTPKKYLEYTKTHSFKVFLICFILSLVFSPSPHAEPTVIFTDITNSLISLLFYFFTLILFSNSTEKEIKIFLWLSLTVIISSLLYDMFWGLPGLYTEEIRKGGFAGNPNIAATAIKFLGLCLLYLYRNNKTIRLLLLTAITISVFMTFSRSGMLGIGLLIFFLIINDWKKTFNFNIKTISIATLKSVFVFTTLFMLLLNTSQFLKNEIPALRHGDAVKRIDLLLGNSKQLQTRDDNNQYGRKNILIRYVNKFKDNPLGYGTGYTADKRINKKDTHNFYLKMAINYGVLGLLIILFFFYKSIRLSFTYNEYYYFVFIMLFSIECIASHSVFLERPTIIALAFMDTILYKTKFNQNLINNNLTPI